MLYSEDMSNWTADISPEEWAEWTAHAKKVAKKNEQKPTSLGFEDYAQQAIEKLFLQEKRPDNVLAWLTTTSKNSYIDRFRKIQARGGESNRDLTDEEWEQKMVDFASTSLSSLIANQKEMVGILATFTEREKELLLFAAAGYKNNEIAIYLDYKNGKIVATRIAQILEKVKKKLTP